MERIAIGKFLGMTEYCIDSDYRSLYYSLLTKRCKSYYATKSGRLFEENVIKSIAYNVFVFSLILLINVGIYHTLKHVYNNAEILKGLLEYDILLIILFMTISPIIFSASRLETISNPIKSWLTNSNPELAYTNHFYSIESLEDESTSEELAQHICRYIMKYMPGNSLKMIERFINLGADINYVPSKEFLDRNVETSIVHGMNLVQIAIHQNKIKEANLLISHGAKL